MKDDWGRGGNVKDAIHHSGELLEDVSFAAAHYCFRRVRSLTSMYTIAARSILRHGSV